MFRAHVWMLLAVAIYGAALETVLALLGPRLDLVIPLQSRLISVSTILCIAAFLLCRFAYIVAVVRPRRLVAHAIDDAASNLFRSDRVLAAVPVLLAFPVFASTFSSFKGLIPALQPFAWDATFAEWDRVLHFGRHPWEWLQPLLGHPAVTAVFNGAYNLWFFVLLGIWIWLTFSRRDPVLRMRYILSFILLWVVIGTIMATLLSSAGPCYFDRVTGLEGPYGGLMSYLREASAQAPIWALHMQEGLWSDYMQPGLRLGGGISAMPSLHVAVATLSALLGWRVSRALGAALTVFAAMIMIGSVHLGWHYAVDGYVSIVATVIIWKGVGGLLARDSFFRRLAEAQPAR